MSEKDLIIYLVEKKIFQNTIEVFKNKLCSNIQNNIKISGTSFEYNFSNDKKIFDLFIEESDQKKFVGEFLLKTFVKASKEKEVSIDIGKTTEINPSNLNRVVLNNNFNSSDVNSIISYIEKELPKYIDNIIIDELNINDKIINCLYNFFYDEENEWSDETTLLKNNINSEIEQIKILKIYNKQFIKETEYYRILNRFKIIEFNDNCIFNNVDTKKLITNNDIQLEFDKCTINGEFEHISCKSLFFNECTIEKYYYDENISNERTEIKDLLFSNCKIDILDLNNVILKSKLFKNTNTMKEEYKKTKLLKITNSKVEKNFRVDIENREKNVKYKRFRITKLDLTNSIFEPAKTKKAKVKIQFCDIGIGVFFNTSFYDLVDFYQTKFRRKVDFERSDFLSISVFSEAIFNCNVNFKYVKFFGKAIFRDAVLKRELNLRDTIFNDEVNFLDITSIQREIKDNQFIGEPTEINVANRETARIIKHFYDSSNNVIEANRFYKLEMQKRKAELYMKDKSKETEAQFLDKLVFFFHEYSSNHSQSWSLALFWIILISILFSFVTFMLYDDACKELIYLEVYKNSYHLKILVFVSYYTVLIYGLFRCIVYRDISNILSVIVVFILGYYIYVTGDLLLELPAKVINPFSIMNNSDSINGIELIIKIIIAYLIYQLIISIRQNTRRK